MDLVALLETAQDRDRVADVGLAHEHRLEAPLERGVLLPVLAVLVERPGAAPRGSRPRANIGLSRLEASTAPSAAPAPTIVWSSSMKRTIWPSAAWISLRTALSRSSNSPRYFQPASTAPMSSAITRRCRSDSGTSPETIRWASPSTIAVLPTPGSPISTGLFLVRL